MLVYSIQNTENGKVYIGQTIRNGQCRKNHHFGNLRRGTHNNPHLQRSYNKYGREAFTFEILAYSQTLQGLNQLEKELIIKHDALNGDNGYNFQSGGDNHTISEETKRKIGKASKGRKMSPKTKEILRLRNKGNTYGKAGKGVKVGADGRKRMSEAAKKRTNNGRCKEVTINRETFQSITKAAKHFGCSRKTIRTKYI